MDIEELSEILTQNVEVLTQLTKKIDKLVALNTKIAKSLHLIPVTEKEEREIQLLQRSNLKLAAKVNEDLAALEPPSETFSQLTMGTLEIAGVFSDVLGSDYFTEE
jgi:hypothetical protein